MINNARPVKFIFIMRNNCSHREVTIVHASFFSSFTRAHLMANLYGFSDVTHLYSQVLEHMDRIENDERD